MNERVAAVDGGFNRRVIGHIGRDMPDAAGRIVPGDTVEAGNLMVSLQGQIDDGAADPAAAAGD